MMLFIREVVEEAGNATRLALRIAQGGRCLVPSNTHCTRCDQ